MEHICTPVVQKGVMRRVSRNIIMIVKKLRVYVTPRKTIKKKVSWKAVSWNWILKNIQNSQKLEPAQCPLPGEWVAGKRQASFCTILNARRDRIRRWGPLEMWPSHKWGGLTDRMVPSPRAPCPFLHVSAQREGAGHEEVLPRGWQCWPYTWTPGLQNCEK